MVTPTLYTAGADKNTQDDQRDKMKRCLTLDPTFLLPPPKPPSFFFLSFPITINQEHLRSKRGQTFVFQLGRVHRVSKGMTLNHLNI